MFRFVFSSIVALSVIASACSSADSGAPTPDSLVTDASTTTTTTTPPVLIATIPNLALPIGECWNELAHTTTTVGERAHPTPTDGDSTTSSTQPTTTQTTIAKPDIVARVSCDGTNQGRVYSSFCMGAESVEEVESAVGAQTADALIRVPCPGDSSQSWPGDRELRRAAARICLETFAVLFGEVYAVSTRVAQELTPNEGLWDRGERRIVCSATEPRPVEITTTTHSD